MQNVHQQGVQADDERERGAERSEYQRVDPPRFEPVIPVFHPVDGPPHVVPQSLGHTAQVRPVRLRDHLPTPFLTSDSISSALTLISSILVVAASLTLAVSSLT